MHESPTNEKKGQIDSISPWIIVLFVVGIWLISWFLLKDLPDRGTFGDMFGAVNALFSGLAFAGVIYAIILQRRVCQYLQMDHCTGSARDEKSQSLSII
jgi:hypothetical protein